MYPPWRGSYRMATYETRFRAELMREQHRRFQCREELPYSLNQYCNDFKHLE
jgi:GTPase Era involved in 16S rRNA processing